MLEFLKVTESLASGLCSRDEVKESHDYMTFSYKLSDGSNSRRQKPVTRDEIVLFSWQPQEKLAISCAMAQSAKLFVFEARLDSTINEVKLIPEELAETGKISWNRRQLSQMIGKLFITRTQINLHSEILDDPDFLWEHDEWEPVFRKVLSYLDVESRVQLVNTRLDLIRELLDVLDTQLENKKSARLEWIVIWLIMAEIVVDVVLYLTNLYMDRSADFDW